ncbi:hypothetical protein CBF60_05400 [Lactobacillus taiwanensis]|uniref:hypothetical protein n=1 Tax=Lactobacillus taiwanensis TaxID=508451 RepID=UPI000B994838|nr:hypothetical protein [Lactobacillus taiwanensis]OYS21770.1 hypothetical protein CBF76_00775 [Lactobacillus taiwanensis]OYS25105.1 hypothetical protein CBF66_03805 [Lactobacillus taiwanensis]OYS25528.1 hypothetical protein CBF73_05590 [Lactobacillus taiwanensis]OYS26154.1 hypothetical protein CBF55_00235 [Lactobacillus taiwanensis]OYS27799.1 hypothetical protein CBF60_05400 [Lactobacillus taiwanensis]
MLHKFKKILHTAHPQHEILAFAMMGIGLILICNDFYFFWPPFAAGFLNDDLVGGLFIAIGIWLFSWAISDKNRIATNRNLLIATAGFLAFEATAEFCHGYVSGHPHMFTAGFLEVIVLLFDFLIIGKSKKHNY